jgi:predicted MFS family arabinose efflux permease
MGIDALAALVVGRLFDRLGFIVLATIPILSIPIAPLVFSFNYALALIGIILWGAVMGIQETVMRASVAEITHASRRGSAYGIFNFAYGLSWFIGSVIMGMLYDKSIADTIFFSIALEVVSLPLLLIVIKSVKNKEDRYRG